jgi:hypothetical protein
MRSPYAGLPRALTSLALVPSPVAGDVKRIPRRRVIPLARGCHSESSRPRWPEAPPFQACLGVKRARLVPNPVLPAWQACAKSMQHDRERGCFRGQSRWSMAGRQFPNLGKPLHGSTGLLLYGLRTFVSVSAAACYQAAGYGRRPVCNGSTTGRGVKAGSVLRREEYVEFGNGRADRGQVRRPRRELTASRTPGSSSITSTRVACASATARCCAQTMPTTSEVPGLPSLAEPEQ